MCDNKCDKCEANEITIKILTNRLSWIEEVLMVMTDTKSMYYMNHCNDMKKAVEHNMSTSVISQLVQEKQKIKESLQPKKVMQF